MVCMTGQLSEMTVASARLVLYARLLRCSQGNNPADCFLYTIRQLPVEERFEWLDSRSDDEVAALVSTHMACLKAR